MFTVYSLHNLSKTPRTAETMLTVSGVGKVKLKRYGRQFLRLIDRYTTDHPNPNSCLFTYFVAKTSSS
ncbi:HRDC domain-containing protein [Chlorobium sp. KB01]|uniref:HRDC domain-containing protein n=1 Tax=Chlorobium sp. KB01 TaxID=1917528 RepID=UPI0009781564|nr:HRDC domain-containing protein [Chlorobium sp. KB01]